MKKSKETGQAIKAGGGQFLLDIRYQQNTSWQGSVQRLDTGEKINFRSALELLTLIEAVVAQQADNGSEPQRFRTWEKTKEVDTANQNKTATGS